MEVRIINRLVYFIFLLIRFLIYPILLIELFSKIFPCVGMGIMLYFPLTMTISIFIGLVLCVFLFFVIPSYKYRIYFEFILIIALIICFLFTFPQDGDPPIYQIIGF
jgi:hypothetical protein